MAFRSMEQAHIARFNSAVSSNFLNDYEKFVSDKLVANSARTPHKTFAPSSFRCNRRSWFRIRGVQPDSVKVPDLRLDFTAQVGTACHETIQKNLKEMLGNDWIDVNTYLRSIDYPYEYTIDHDVSNLETRITIQRPPLTFSCDGLLKRNNEYYLLEIKTAEFSTWDNLTDVKEEHIDQIKCYATLLQLEKALVVYQDRQYGGFKCYEIKISPLDKEDILNRFEYVLDMVDKNLAPDGLPQGDKWCSPSMCPYYKKCQEYGR